MAGNVSEERIVDKQHLISVLLPDDPPVVGNRIPVPHCLQVRREAFGRLEVLRVPQGRPEAEQKVMEGLRDDAQVFLVLLKVTLPPDQSPLVSGGNKPDEASDGGPCDDGKVTL